MQKWIISANSNMFDHKRAFQELGYIDWKQTRNFSVGDIVYIYVTKPESRIKYKTRVVAVDLSANQIENFDKFWVKKTSGNNEKNYFRLKMLEEFDNSLLSFEHLQNNGMRYAPQSPCRIKEELEEYLNSLEVKD